jgi:two-component system OmpR family sensor kinase
MEPLGGRPHPGGGWARGASLFSQAPTMPNPIIVVRADAGTTALLAGIALSVPALFGVACWGWGEARCHDDVMAAHREAAEERRRFLRRLDHELKNPLTAIRVGLANLCNGPRRAAQQQALSSVEAEVLRLSRLTADLRKLADLETRPLERVPLDATELLEEVVSVARKHPCIDATPGG